MSAIIISERHIHDSSDPALGLAGSTSHDRPIQVSDRGAQWNMIPALAESTENE